MHRVHTTPLSGRSVADTLRVTGDEAKHALRVKRLQVGDALELADGQGMRATATILASGKSGRDAEWWMDLRLDDLRRLPKPSPRLEVWSAVPKGDRVEAMIDALSQVGVAEWSPLASARAIVEPRPAKVDRLRRHAVEASKQCGRAWNLEIGPGGDFDAALAAPRVVLADASGERYEPQRHALAPALAPAPIEPIRLLIGPEGGWTPDELAQARARTATIACFGPHTMRIETAAAVAAAIILDHEIAPT